MTCVTSSILMSPTRVYLCVHKKYIEDTKMVGIRYVPVGWLMR